MYKTLLCLFILTCLCDKSISKSYFTNSSNIDFLSYPLCDSLVVDPSNCNACELLAEIYEEEIKLGQDTVICNNDSIFLHIAIPDATIIWNTGIIADKIAVGLPGSYWATVIVEDCEFFSDTVSITAQGCLTCDYYIPNAFSPNEDGINDYFQVYLNEADCSIQNIEMRIFNRWGNLIFEGGENAWDGSPEKAGLKNESFVYIIQMKLLRDGQTIDVIESGTIRRLR